MKQKGIQKPKNEVAKMKEKKNNQQIVRQILFFFYNVKWIERIIWYDVWNPVGHFAYQDSIWKPKWAGRKTTHIKVRVGFVCLVYWWIFYSTVINISMARMLIAWKKKIYIKGLDFGKRKKLKRKKPNKNHNYDVSSWYRNVIVSIQQHT